MKKTIITFVLIIIGVYVVLTVLDTSEYKVERALWRVNQDYNEVAADPTVVPDKRFDDIARTYIQIVKKYPNSALTPRAYLQVGRLYALNEDYEKARSYFQEFLSRYPDLRNLRAEAEYSIGITYEKEGNIAEAVRVFDKTASEYSDTGIGQSAPLYVADLYTRRGAKAETGEALRKAAAYYREQIAQKPKSAATFNAQRLLTTAYFAQQDWTKAVDNLATVLLEYPEPEYLTPQRANLLVKSINMVAMTKLQNYDKPIGIYEEFLQKNPDHPLNPYFEQMIKALNALKERKVSITIDQNKQ